MFKNIFRSTAVLFGLLALLCQSCTSVPTEARAEAATPQEKIIVSGASGQLGELVVKELIKRGVAPENLILVSRTPENLDQYAKLGASVRFGDMSRPESLSAAYAGGTRMLLISVTPGAGSRPQLHKAGFDAAVTAGVKHIVYTSLLGVDTGTSAIAVDHRQSEEALQASGAKWTMLRNGFYADRAVQQALDMIKTGRVVVAPDEAKSAFVTREDCAAAAAGALLNPGLAENQAYDITGPALFDSRDVAAVASAVTGKRIEIVEQSATETATMPATFNAMLKTLPAIVTNHVVVLSGRPATSLQVLLEAHKEELLAVAKESN